MLPNFLVKSTPMPLFYFETSYAISYHFLCCITKKSDMMVVLYYYYKKAGEKVKKEKQKLVFYFRLVKTIQIMHDMRFLE